MVMPVVLERERDCLEGGEVCERRIDRISDQRQISLLCVINALGTGGAESMLHRLLAHLDRDQFRVRVVTLIDHLEPVGSRIRALGIPVETLGMRRGVPNPVYLWRLLRLIRHDPPDVIQTWLYHADLLGGLAAQLAGNIPVIWSIRHADLSKEGNPWLTRQTVRLCAGLSQWLPSRIVCNSEASQKLHVVVGYAPTKVMVIPNGVDSDVYQPDELARNAVRRELKVPATSPLVGLVGRFHPHKDHHTFVKAAAILSRRLPEVHYLLCGRDVTGGNRELVRWIEEAGISARVRLLGDRVDIPRLLASLDVAASSSFGESFPNAIAEAMSCGVPCVVTDVGDSASIVGETGETVPSRDPGTLAGAMLKLLQLDLEERRRMGAAARRRVQERFSLRPVVARYESLFREVICAA